jgi:sporulation protein YlmC with PRC-barrel domain
MLHKDEFLSTHPEVHTGMDAYSTDGEKLGQVELLDEDSIVIEKGWFFPKDFTIRYDDVSDIRGDDMIVSKSRDELDEWRRDRYPGWDEYERTARESEYERTGREEEARIPLREEELEAEKRRREGEVHLRKVVHTEMKHLEVPVQKEDVEVERNEPRKRKR